MRCAWSVRPNVPRVLGFWDCTLLKLGLVGWGCLKIPHLPTGIRRRSQIIITLRFNEQKKEGNRLRRHRENHASNPNTRNETIRIILNDSAPQVPTRDHPFYTKGILIIFLCELFITKPRPFHFLFFFQLGVLGKYWLVSL